MAADRMAAQLLKLAKYAENEAVQLRAVDSALDRTIGKAPTTVEIGPTKPYEEVMGDVFQGISPMTRAESRRARGLSDEGSTQPAVGLFEDIRDTSGSESSGGFGSGEQRPHSSPASAAQDSSPFDPPRQPRSRKFDREREAQPQYHVTGEDAIRLANQANRAIGALPEPRAIESRHKRYPRR